MSSGLNLKHDLPYYLVSGKKLSRTQVFPAASGVWGLPGPPGTLARSHSGNAGIGWDTIHSHRRSSGLVFSEKVRAVSGDLSPATAAAPEPSPQLPCPLRSESRSLGLW